MFHEEIPPALRATSLSREAICSGSLMDWASFQGRLFHRHLSLSPKQFPAPENISENFVKTIAIPNEMWYNKFCEPLHKACAAFPCIPSRLSRRLLCQKFSAYTPLCRACAHDIRQYRTKSVWRLCTPLFVSSDEKFDDASVAQSLCGIAIKTCSETRLWQVLIFVRAVLFRTALRKDDVMTTSYQRIPLSDAIAFSEILDPKLKTNSLRIQFLQPLSEKTQLPADWAVL